MKKYILKTALLTMLLATAAAFFCLTASADEFFNDEKYRKIYYDDMEDTLRGDVNCDSEIDTRDIVLLSQHLAKWNVVISEHCADCNGDGKVDTIDAVLLAQYLAKWNVAFAPENIPFVPEAFSADEVYLITDKTCNTQIYHEDGITYYVYANLYNMIDNKYEDSVIFTGNEIQVIYDIIFGFEIGDISTAYGYIITRDSNEGTKVYTPNDYTDDKTEI